MLGNGMILGVGKQIEAQFCGELKDLLFYNKVESGTMKEIENET